MANMRYIIGGAGEVGYHLAKSLADEELEVIVVETDQSRLERVNSLDVQAEEGNIAERKFLEGLIDRDRKNTFIAATGIDEVNLVACSLAKTLGCTTIARLNNTSYMSGDPYTSEYQNIGVDQAVCPEMVAAIRILNILDQDRMMPSQSFLNGRIHVAEARVLPDSTIVGREVGSLVAPSGFILFAIYRGDSILVPRKATRINAHDRLMMAVKELRTLEEVREVIGSKARELDPEARHIRRVMIAGTNRVAIHLAKLLTQPSRKDERREVAILERNEQRAIAASEDVPRAHVYVRDASLRSDLMSENVDTYDCFIAATQDEGFNVLSALQAKHLGVPKTIAVVHHPEHKLYLEGDLVDLVVAPRLSTVGALLKIIHANNKEIEISSLGNSGMTSYDVRPGSEVIGRPIRDLNLPDHCIIAAVARGDETVLPRGDFMFQAGDEVLAYARSDALPGLERVFA